MSVTSYEAHFYGPHAVPFQRRGAFVPPFDTRQTSLALVGCRGENWLLVSFRVVSQRHRKLDHWNANTDFLWDKRTGLAAKTVKTVN